MVVLHKTPAAPVVPVLVISYEVTLFRLAEYVLSYSDYTMSTKSFHYRTFLRRLGGTTLRIVHYIKISRFSILRVAATLASI
jgi:hypothetical protein